MTLGKRFALAAIVACFATGTAAASPTPALPYVDNSVWGLVVTGVFTFGMMAMTRCVFILAIRSVTLRCRRLEGVETWRTRMWRLAELVIGFALGFVATAYLILVVLFFIGLAVPRPHR